MRRNARGRIAAMAIGAALGALVLVGCTPPEAIGTAGGGPGSARTPSSTNPVDPTPAATPTPATPVAGDPAPCLVGTWLADNAWFLGLMQGFGDEVHSVTGAVELEFREDGAMTTDYQDWRILASAEGHDVTVRRHGLDTGTYTATSTSLSFADTAIGSTIVLSGEGLEMSVAPTPNSVANATYTCDASTAQVHAPDGDLQLHRR